MRGEHVMMTISHNNIATNASSQGIKVTQTLYIIIQYVYSNMQAGTNLWNTYLRGYIQYTFYSL